MPQRCPADFCPHAQPAARVVIIAQQIVEFAVAQQCAVVVGLHADPRVQHGVMVGDAGFHAILGVGAAVATGVRELQADQQVAAAATGARPLLPRRQHRDGGGRRPDPSGWGPARGGRGLQHRCRGWSAPRPRAGRLSGGHPSTGARTVAAGGARASLQALAPPYAVRAARGIGGRAASAAVGRRGCPRGPASAARTGMRLARPLVEGLSGGINRRGGLGLRRRLPPARRSHPPPPRPQDGRRCIRGDVCTRVVWRDAALPARGVRLTEARGVGAREVHRLRR